MIPRFLNRKILQNQPTPKASKHLRCANLLTKGRVLEETKTTPRHRSHNLRLFCERRGWGTTSPKLRSKEGPTGGKDKRSPFEVDEDPAEAEEVVEAVHLAEVVVQGRVEQLHQLDEGEKTRLSVQQSRRLDGQSKTIITPKGIKYC